MKEHSVVRDAILGRFGGPRDHDRHFGRKAMRTRERSFEDPGQTDLSTRRKCGALGQVRLSLFVAAAGALGLIAVRHRPPVVWTASPSKLARWLAGTSGRFNA